MNPSESAEPIESTVRRCYVMKKRAADRRSEEIATMLREQLRCFTVDCVQTAVRYDTEGTDEATFVQSQSTVFAEAPVDDVLDEQAFDKHRDGKTEFGIEALPGQYDQHADAAEQTVQIESGGDRPNVSVADFVLIEGTIEPDKLAELKHMLINPTDSRETSYDRPVTLKEHLPRPFDVRIIDGFIECTQDALADIRKEFSLAMTLDDLHSVRAHFQHKHRNPTVTELRVLDTYWSDHCRHTTFTTELLEIAIGGRTLIGDGQWINDIDSDAKPVERMIAQELRRFFHDRDTFFAAPAEGCCWDNKTAPFSLMDLALFSMREAKGRLNDLEDSEENNAASIIVPVKFDDGRTEECLLMFKNETHNHPTEIEPYGGAATCLGGAIRDPLSGRSYPFMAMRISGSGDPRELIEQTLTGKLPQRQITQTAVAGFAGYGNQIGLPTPAVREFYHPGFKAKRFECGFVAGAVKREHVVRKKPLPGDVILLVGGRTGRDGIGGASGSSKAHDSTSITSCGAEVQKGNPVEERKLERLFGKPDVSKLIKRCNDFGAGGVAVAVGELADGVFINLDAVPLKYQSLDGTEIAISESQERMAVVIAAKDKKEFIRMAEEENLEATQIGMVTNTNKMVMEWRGKTICSLERPMLAGGWAKREAAADIHATSDIASPEIQGDTFAEKWTENLRHLNVCSQRGLQNRFDSTVGAHTVVGPHGGIHQLSPSEAAVVAFPAEGSRTAAVTSYGYDPELAQKSPFHGALFAVVDSLARLVASGASFERARLTLQNYFERLDQDPARWGKPLAAQLGARMAQRELGTPAIGGKDSMSGSYIDKTTGARIDVPPTIVSFAVATMDREAVIPSHFQKSGSTIVELQVPLDKSAVPDWQTLRQMWKRVHFLSKGGMILSSHAVHAGGVAAAVSEMSFGNAIGVDLDAKALAADAWFQPSYGSMVVELPTRIKARDVFHDLPHAVLGTTTEGSDITLHDDTPQTLSQDALLKAWEEPLESIFPTKPRESGDGSIIERSPYAKRAVRTSDLQPIVHPQVTILTFPGTNCEIETASAFERAGARTVIPVFVNRTHKKIQESIARFASEIEKSQILAFPGGFSEGDEPDGSGKFIAAVLRNPRIKESIEQFLDRDGLILGICNGFQGLIKSCLLPGGTIGILKEIDPTLTHNTIGRYLSQMSRHRVTSVLSPWMDSFEPGELVDFPIAHGEGRLIQPPADVWENGQVPFQYVGQDGVARMRFPDNPNGSDACAAALTDRTGRIFGMMAHPERALPGLSTNIPGERKGMKIFEGGVRYFS